jgi:hypothetical protein
MANSKYITVPIREIMPTISQIIKEVKMPCVLLDSSLCVTRISEPEES